MESLVEALAKVKQLAPRGLIVRSPSIESFCVGADIGLIQSVTDPREGAALARQGQEAYNLIQDLGCTTVAAIGGPCVGGGCELVLACTYRIASDDPATSIGLPETKLGILPGFGGTYRLPRVVGLPKALDIILAGKTLRAQQALKSGLIDEVVSKDALYERAHELATGQHHPKRRSRSLGERLLTSTSIGRAVVRRNALKATRAATKGAYPAPIKALEVTIAGLAKSRGDALRVEAEALGELIVTPESKALVHLFYLTEAAKGLGKAARAQLSGTQALVIGAGTMGAGIAGTLAKSGYQVIVKDTSDSSLERGKAHVAKELSKIRHLQDCIIASNTSSLSVSEMSNSMADPQRFVGMHFFNPVEKMPLVEIIRGEKTSDETIARVAALSTAMGKFPIVVQDVPGFLINRILIPYLNEAVFLLQEGFSATEIDAAALQFGMPMGPIRLLDEVGLDVAAHVSTVMTQGYGERMAVPAFAEALLKLDRKGRKNGKGFYNYTNKDAQVWQELSKALSLPAAPKSSLSRSELADRLIVHLVNEAMKCLNEGVAGSEPELAAKQIDLGTVMGIGFPPYRGGVLYYAKKRGLAEIRTILERFATQYGLRYSPW
jgi:3-hydroxyacyl-CoA dehydrogenase/enoyl-CoA hydratase/3-hydroxybutyryl-CoA epimerase